MSQRRRDQLTRDLFRDWLEDIVKWGLLFNPPFALTVLAVAESGLFKKLGLGQKESDL